MIQFTELKIHPEDGGYITLKASIQNESYFDNIVMDSVVIDNQETYNSDGPSDNPVYSITFSDDRRSIDIIIRNNEILGNLLSDLFFVYIKVRGTFASNTPCGLDKVWAMCPILYPYPLYCNMLKLLKLEEATPCTSNRAFLDYFMKFKALQFALYTQNGLRAIEYFKLLKGNVNIVHNNPCNCHGN